MKPENRWIARLARAGFLLVLTIVASSAFIRLSAGDPEASVAAIETARIAHRISASIAGILVLLVAGLILTRDHIRRADGALAVATIVVMLTLAWIGRYSGPDASAMILVSNLIGGLALSSLLWAVAARQSTAEGPAASTPRAALAFVTLFAVALQSTTGAMAVTEFASVGPIHHWSGILAFALCAWLGTRLAQSPAMRLTGCAILVLAVLQAALGISALALSLPLWLVLAHNVSAAFLLAALVQSAVAPKAGN